MKFLAILLALAFAGAAQAAPYALINSTGDTVIEIREWGSAPPDLGASGTPNNYWLAYTRIDPAFNSATQVRTGPVRTIEADRVADTWTVRDKTAQELADEATARKDDAMSVMTDIDGFDRAFVSVLIEEFNRHAASVQAIKDAAAGASTLAQFKAAMATVQVPPARNFEDLRTTIRNKLGQ